MKQETKELWRELRSGIGMATLLFLICLVIAFAITFGVIYIMGRLP